MDDGKLIGRQTEEDEEHQIREDYSTGVQKNNQWARKNRLNFSSLVDVDHVRAIWFGDQRIEV